jgi:hypothetical protein
MTETTVVNISNTPDFNPKVNDGDVYIGRYNPKFGASIWRNVFKLTDYPIKESLRLYKIQILSRPDLLARLPELKGKRLGCWCAPDRCHGDVLVQLIEERGL